MICGVEGRGVVRSTGREGRVRSNQNGRRENANELREAFVQRYNCPTQAKTGLECGHPSSSFRSKDVFSTAYAQKVMHFAFSFL